MEDKEEKERRKRAIFDTMGKRGQKWVMRIGWENWDPFQEPKDPRERISGTAAVRSKQLLQQYYRSRQGDDDAGDHHYELMEICRKILEEDSRTLRIYDFCVWLHQQQRAEQEKP